MTMPAIVAQRFWRSIEERCQDVEKMFRAGMEVNTRIATSGETALTTAIKHHRREEPLDFIKLLIDLGADVNAKVYNGETPLIKAIKVCMKEDIIELLLVSGADVDHADDDGFSFLDYLDEVGCYASFDYIRCIRYWKRSALMSSVWEGKSLCIFEQNLNVIDDSDIYDAIMMENKDISNPSGWTLLHAAVFLQRTEYVKVILEFLEKRARQDLCFKQSSKKLQTALMIASAKGYTDIVLLFGEIIFSLQRKESS